MLKRIKQTSIPLGTILLATGLTLNGGVVSQGAAARLPETGRPGHRAASLVQPLHWGLVVMDSIHEASIHETGEVGQVKQNSAPGDQPVVPPLPEDIPGVVDPSPEGIIGLAPGPEDNIGVGHLRPDNLNSLEGDDWTTSPMVNGRWLKGTALPIYIGPGSDHWGWLINGWLIPNGYDPIAVGRDATFTMVQPQRGLYTFPVMEIQQDGWFRFQYTPAGTAWSHISQLDLGSTRLQVESWSDWLAQANRVEFRKHGASQPLRPEPTTSTALQSLVGANSLIEPLDIQDDWMRVRVTQPASGCQPLPGSTTEEGWMRWQDDDAVPLIWFPTDGC
jgi:hypothetical protein